MSNYQLTVDCKTAKLEGYLLPMATVFFTAKFMNHLASTILMICTIAVLTCSPCIAKQVVCMHQVWVYTVSCLLCTYAVLV